MNKETACFQACPVCQSFVQAIDAKHEKEVGIKPHTDGVIYRKVNSRSMGERLAELEMIAETACEEGDCDLTPPYENCPGCAAGAKLNQIGEML